MITAENIRDAIAISAVAEIGTYNYGETTTPALWIDALGRSPDSPVSGIEVVIQPALDVPIMIRQGGYIQVIRHSITIKQWDINATIDTAFGAILPVLMGYPELTVGSIVRRPRVSALDNIEEISIAVSQQIWTGDGELGVFDG